MAPKKTFDLSPSVLHQRLLKVKPLLTFDYGDWVAWQNKLRLKVAELTGFAIMPSGEARCDLNVRKLWGREFEHGIIEKIVFTSEPGADVIAYVCLPADAKPPYDWFICLQGHSTGMHNSIAVDFATNKKRIAVEGDRDFGLGCMKRSLAALCLEQRCFGERGEVQQKDRSERMCFDAAMHSLMLGRTLVGERVFDVDRAIDYLFTRDDVRLDTIGVMGHSGGGTVSLFAAALLSRLKRAILSGCFCTFRDSIMSLHHCECNYIPGLLRYAEMADIIGLFARRPVVIVNGDSDPIFPVESARTEFYRLKEIYHAVGAEEKCYHVIGDGGHRFYAKQAWDVMRKEID